MSTPEAVAPAAVKPEDDDTPRVEINFPGFNVFKARQEQTNGKVVRSMSDKTHDFSQIRDVHNVALYACEAATAAISAYNEVMHPFYVNAMQQLANTVAWAIREAIAEYEFNRRHSAWHRKLWRRIRSQPYPTRTPTPAA